MDKRLDEQNYLWLMRAFTVFAAVSALLAAVLVIAYLTISPGYKWDAFFVAFRSDNVETMFVRRINNKTITRDSVAESIAKHLIATYVHARETFAFDANSEIVFMSSAEVRREMLKTRRPAGTITAAVTSEGVQFHDRQDLWVVEVELTLTDKAGAKRQIRRKIELKATFLHGQPEQMAERSGALKWVNPLGFMVTSYKVVGDM